MTSLATPFFDHAHPKNFDQLLVFVNLYQHAKNQLLHLFICSSISSSNFQSHLNLHEFAPACKTQLISSIHSLMQSILESRDHSSHTHFNQKILDRLLIFVNLYQHATKWGYFIDLLQRIVDLKILQSDWLRAFWPTSQE